MHSKLFPMIASGEWDWELRRELSPLYISVPFETCTISVIKN